LKVRYTIDALTHIASIYAFIKERNATSATRVAARIQAAANRLGDFPEIGRVGAVSGTREWVVKGLPYIIVHELHWEDDQVVILGIYHGMQLRPGQAEL
jgi:plasmid stabilization system protein ParE